jgi:hypothetical protein
MSNKSIWYLPGPFHQYQEDVKALAKKAGLRIIDANVTEFRDDEADDTPEVTLKELPPQLVVDVVGEDQSAMEDLVGKLQAESDSIRLLIDGLDAGEVERPGAGELAIRLYDALDHIRAQVGELVSKRDELAADNEKLRGELDALKAGEGQEVEALKAQLDAAGVTYRANASKESLERLVAELPKA